ADSLAPGDRQPSTTSQARPTDRDPAQFNHDPIQSVRLPPLELPEFKGAMHAFPEFWEMFAAAVHDDPTLPTISKFLYLKGKLKGEAYKLISPLQFSEFNYQQAVQLLKKTYMRPDILRIQLVQKLHAVPLAHDIPTSQRSTLCTLKALWVQLEKLGEHPASTAHKCTIGEKFPLRTMEKAGELKNAGEDWTVNHLLDALDQVIDRQEALQGVQPALASAHVTQQHSEETRRVQHVETPQDGIATQHHVRPVDDLPAQSLPIQTADGHVRPAGPLGTPPLAEAVLPNVGTLPIRESGLETHLPFQIQFNLIITLRPPGMRATRATSRPFENIGLDYLGPLLIRTDDNKDRKTWVCLFTCMSTRAVHLELVVDNTTTHFLLAFRRSISRRGTPNLVISDNAPTFKLGREVLVNELRQFTEDRAVLDFSSSTGFEWRFITPLSPWKGGFYERLEPPNAPYGDRIHAKYAPTNSTFRRSDRTSSYPTAHRFGHLGNPKMAVTSRDPFTVTESQEFLVCQYSLLKDSLKTFWELWHKEYLQALAQRSQIRSTKQQSAARQPHVGDVVLIQTDNTSRSNWPLGLIVKINSSADGSITLKPFFVQQCPHNIVVKPVEDEATMEVASIRNPLHAADEEDVKEGQVQQPAKKPRAASPTPIQKEGKVPSAPQQPAAPPLEEPSQAGATGQETPREETISAADHPRYKELLALLRIRLNSGAPSDNSATAAQSSAASSSATDTRSTHQLTETGFRTVFDYININNLLRPNIEALKIPVKEVTPSRRADYEAVARIVELLRSMQELSTTTTQRFHNLGVLMTLVDPLQFRYTVLMGWIHELVHRVALLNDYTYQLNHITVPRLLDWAEDRDYFLRVRGRSPRMIRVVEAHQLLLVLHAGVGVITNEDQQYAVNSSLPIPEPILADRHRIEETIQWWRENYTNALMITVADDYLRTHSVDQFLQEERQARERQEAAPQQAERSTTHVQQSTAGTEPPAEKTAPAPQQPSTSAAKPQPPGSAASQQPSTSAADPHRQIRGQSQQSRDDLPIAPCTSRPAMEDADRPEAHVFVEPASSQAVQDASRSPRTTQPSCRAYSIHFSIARGEIESMARTTTTRHYKAINDDIMRTLDIMYRAKSFYLSCSNSTVGFNSFVMQ
ncbi:unnamed protein product, partial [Heligmosomoides polygyrus]|uniref:Integrase catalytic domain-containing protein n=1 Tax=Heligmosomoides polygyrus TaxID=6339 RepID=A0A183GNB9_HELPZ